QKERRAVQFVEDHVDGTGDEPAQLRFRRRRTAHGVVEQFLEAIVRIFVAGEEDLFLVLEVVVEIALLHAQRRRDLFDRGAVITELAERRGRALEDFYAGGCAGFAAAGALREAPPAPALAPDWNRVARVHLPVDYPILSASEGRQRRQHDHHDDR